MTAFRLERKESDHAVGSVESLVWGVLIVSGLGVVVWTVATIVAQALLR